MAINKINNGDSGSVVRGIINAVIDAVNGLTTSISSIIQRVEYVEKTSTKGVIHLIGEQDGINKKFVPEKDYIFGTSQLYVNGIRFFINIDYEETESEIGFLVYLPKETDILIFEAVEL